MSTLRALSALVLVLAGCQEPLINVGEFAIADASRKPATQARDAAPDGAPSAPSDPEEDDDGEDFPEVNPPANEDAGVWFPFWDAGPIPPARIRDLLPRFCVDCTADVACGTFPGLACRDCNCCENTRDCDPPEICWRPDFELAGFCRDPNPRGPP